MSESDGVRPLVVRLRQDAGLGVSLRLQGKAVAQGYVAFGNGAKFGYNFVKMF